MWRTLLTIAIDFITLNHRRDFGNISYGEAQRATDDLLRGKERTLGEARGAQQAFQNIFNWPRCSLWAFQRPWFGLTYWRALPPHPLWRNRGPKMPKALEAKIRCIWTMMPSLFISITHKGEDKDKVNYIYKDEDKTRDFSFLCP